MAQQQRYSIVPGFGPNGGYSDSNIQGDGVGGSASASASMGNGNRRYSGFDFDNLADDRYHTPHFLATDGGRSQSGTSSYRDLPSPPHRSRSSYGAAAAGIGAGAGAASMPLMDQGTPRPFASDYARQNIPSEEYFPNTDPNGTNEKYTGFTASRPARNNKKWWIIGGVVLGVAALIGIIVGVVVSQVNKNNNSSSSSSSNGSSSNSTNELKNANDPSDFDKDSKLHQSFWGFAYTPQEALLPWCGASQNNVTRDIQLLSQVTTRLRLYGANCNQSALVLQAIQDTKVDMTVWLGIYVDSNETAYENQLAAVSDALKTYGTDHVSGITVGNEYILNTAGTDSTTSSIYLSAAKTITDKIQEVNTTIQGLGLSKALPIGTSDAGSVMSKTLGEGIDYFMANVHPWFGSVAIDDAAQWTEDFFQEFDVAPAALASNKPAVYIAETGWPTQSMNASEANDGAGSPQGDASVANLQTFLDTFVCQANANGTNYFYFEAFDEPWKEQFGGVEPYWGLWDSDRNLKDVTIPTCS
ncbi:uncharacterized protein I303_105555 [Kwoniella dejecticola CBS 10117]|uniref:glucan endo-1,3-beta-D-glucosidase n=1 Tax=Kwoniella dejecticola CBS 10117 TaxID=1296121 RepID=A0A1A6A256_9TREE|nr:glucan 1,3-beta-glucosidase [Kwoniella dejecticola CBS 10117]OBR84145.1 glucan 1,3-beta-glucosidase [Kwoniella dejecticola CBS 10117]